MTFEVSDKDRELLIKALSTTTLTRSPGKARTCGSKSLQTA